MNDQDLIVTIGAETSAVSAALAKMTQDVKDTAKTLNKVSNIDLFATSASSFAKQMDIIERGAAAAARHIKKQMTEALKLDVNNNDYDRTINRYMDAYAKAVKQNAIEINKWEELKAKETSKNILKQEKAAITARTRALKEQMETRYKEEKAHAKKVEDIQNRTTKTYYKNRSNDIKLLMRQYENASRSQQAIELRRLRNLSDAQRRYAVQAIQSSSNPNNDITAHRSLIDSVKLVARYGLISQALFGLQAAFRDAISEVGRFDQSIQDNIAILQKTKSEAIELSTNVTAIGIKYGESLDEVQKGMIVLGRAGVESMKELKGGTEGLAALSVITGDAMHYGAEAMSSLLAVYPQLADSMGILANKMGAVANATRLGLEDFSTIGNYALVTAKNVGLSSDSYLALAGSMSKVGVSASSIGTSIARINKIVTDGSSGTQKFFNMLNISQDRLRESLRDDPLTKNIDESKVGLIQIARLLGEEVKQTEKWARATADLNIQDRKTINQLAAMGSSAELTKMYDKIENAKDVTKQAAVAAEGLERKWTSIKNIFKEQVQLLSPDISVTIEKFLPTAETFKTVLSTLFTNISNTLSVIDEFAVAIGSWYIITKVTKWIQGAETAMLLLTNSMARAIIGAKLLDKAITGIKAIFSPVGAAIAVITAAYALWDHQAQKNIETQNKLRETLDLTTEEMEKLTKAQASQKGRDLALAEVDAIHKLRDARGDLTAAKRDSGSTKDELLDLEVIVDTRKQELDAIREKRGVLKEVREAQAKVKVAMDATAASANTVTRNATEIALATLQGEKAAYKLAEAFRTAVSTFNNAMINLKVASGGMTGALADQERFSLAYKTNQEKLILLKKEEDLLSKSIVAGTEKDVKLSDALVKVASERAKTEAEAAQLQADFITKNSENEKTAIQQKYELQQANIRKLYANKNGDYSLIEKQKQVAIEQLNLKSLNEQLKVATTLDDKKRIALDIATQEATIQERISSERNAQQKLADKNNKDAEHAGKAADRAAKQADTTNARLQKENEELKKQIDLRTEIDKLLNGENTKTLTARIETAKAEWDSAKALLIANAKLIVGEKSKLKYTKDQTKELEAQKKYLELINEKIGEYASAYSSMFSSIFNNGDIKSALLGFGNDIANVFSKDFISSMSQSLAKITQSFSASITSSLSGITGISSGVIGGVIGVGISAAVSSVGKLFKSTISESDMKLAEGIKDVISDTITNSLDTIERNSAIGLKYSSRMVDSLEQIVSLTNSAASNIGTDLTGENYVASTDYGFFNDSTKELVSTGIKLNAATLDQIANDQMSATKYMTEKITDSGFLGIGAGESLKTTNLGDADSSIMAPINEAYKNAISVIEDASTVLNVSADDFSAAAADWSTSIAQLNFAGKTQEEIADMINGAISADMDTLAAQIPQLEEYIATYKKAGEGAGETVVRLANDFEVVERSMKDLQIPMKSVADGGIAVAEALIDAAGGMDSYLSAMATFTQNFYTDTEQQAMAQRQLSDAMAELNLAMPATAMGYRQLVESLLASNSAVAGQVLALSSLAATAYNAASTIGSAAISVSGAATSCSSAAGSCSLAASACSDAADEAAAAAMSLKRDIASLRSEWMGGADGAKLMLQTVQEATGLIGVSYENFLDMFTKASASPDFTQDDLSDWKDLSDALQTLHDAISELSQNLYDLTIKGTESVLSFNATSIDKTFGSLEGYLNNQDYVGASSAFDNIITAANEDTQSTYKSRLFSIARANNMIQGIEANNPNAEIVKELQMLRKENEGMKEKLNEIEYNTHKSNTLISTNTKVVGL